MQKIVTAFCLAVCLSVMACQDGGVKPPMGTGADGQPADSITNWHHFVSKERSLKMIARYKEVRASMTDGTQKFGMELMSQAERYDSAQSMLAYMMRQKNCTGIRVYYGFNDDNRIVPLICGIDAKGNDIYWHRKKTAQATTDKKVAAKSLDGEPDPTTGDDEEGLLDMAQKEPPPLTSGTITLIP